jgi:hypothetical protein
MAKNWIKGAIKHPGSFKAAAQKAGKSTAEYASEKADAPGMLGRRARLAQTLMGMRKHKRYGGAPPDDDGD